MTSHVIHMRKGPRGCLILHDQDEDGSKDKGAGSRKRVAPGHKITWRSHEGAATITFFNGNPLCDQSGRPAPSVIRVPRDNVSDTFTICSDATQRYKYLIAWNDLTPGEDPQVIIDGDNDSTQLLKAFTVGLVAGGVALWMFRSRPDAK